VFVAGGTGAVGGQVIPALASALDQRRDAA
jgi:hypothetical protein